MDRCRLILAPFLLLAAVVSADSGQTGECDTYEVLAGDTLWDIARTRLGNPFRYKEIARLNGISDPDFIMVGQRLRLPRPVGEAGIEALLLRARTFEENLELGEAAELWQRITHFFPSKGKARAENRLGWYRDSGVETAVKRFRDGELSRRDYLIAVGDAYADPRWLMWPEAVRAYEAALESGLADAELLLRLGVAYYQRRVLYLHYNEEDTENDLPKADDCFRRIIREFPDDELADNAQFMLGELYGNCYRCLFYNEYEKAVVEYQKLLDRYPESELRERAEQAIERCRKALTDT